jgi:hypothetical protein
MEKPAPGMQIQRLPFFFFSVEQKVAHEQTNAAP